VFSVRKKKLAQHVAFLVVGKFLFSYSKHLDLFRSEHFNLAIKSTYRGSGAVINQWSQAPIFFSRPLLLDLIFYSHPVRIVAIIITHI
jgi:hypothetical protein